MERIIAEGTLDSRIPVAPQAHKRKLKPTNRSAPSAFRRPPIVNLQSKIENSSCLSKYSSVFV